MNVRIDGLPQLESTFKRITADLTRATRYGALKAAREGIEEATRVHQYQDRTGNLTRSAYARLEGAGAAMVWPVPYASYVEYGTAPHVIEGNPWLAFQWKGVPVFFRRVHHPGSRPYTFAGPAYLKAERVLYREIEIAVFRAQQTLNASAA